MARRLSFLLSVLFLGAPARAGEGDGYVYRLENTAEFERLSVSVASPPGVDRATKFMVPVTDNPLLLRTLFQNVNRYRFHQEFLAGEFPDRFPGLTGREYLTLVEKREGRSYFAGVIFRFKANPDVTYGFDVFTLSGDLTELPRVEEVRWIHDHLKAVFTVGPIAYSPRDPEAIKNAKTWTDPGFPIKFVFGAGFVEYIPYTIAENYGRVKVLTLEEFTEANDTGAFSWQDIVVVEHAPADIEGVIAGVITGNIQSELGHLAIRTGRRGTPNAYVRDAVAKFTPYNGKLVRLQVKADRYEVTEAVLADAEAWWAAHRPKIEIPEVDAEHRRLDAVWEVPLDGSVRLVTRYGGKGSNFARLYAFLKQENRVPGFLIPFAYYIEFLESNRAPSPIDPGRRVTYAQYIEELLADPAFRGDSRRRFEELEKLRELIEDGVVDPGIVRAMALRVVQVFGGSERRVRFRSSSNVEDLLEFNGAGLYNSYSACAADDLDSGNGGPSRCVVPSEPPEQDERGVARALKKVWASLWNYRAFEEREYFQVPHGRARMAVLVSEGFPDELANGVAFTGNPTVIGDRRFVINVQLGDVEVVFTDPGVVAEKDLLVMENGQVASVIRVRPSSLVKPGEFVLTDDQLRELGSVMAHVEKNYAIDLGSHQPEEVVLDFEFKLDPTTKHIRLKQVRPFLIASSSVAPPEFRLNLPEPITACASFFEGRPARKVLGLKARVGLRPGEYVLRPDGTSPVDLVEWLQLGPTAELLAPLGPGLWTALPIEDPEPGYRFEMSQDFNSGGEKVRVSLVNLDLASGGSRNDVLAPTDITWAINSFFVRLELTFPDDPTEAHRTTWFLPCDLGHLPLHTVDVQFAGGDRVRMIERFQDVLDGTGPAELVGAQLKLGGADLTVEDYWRLVYTAGHHNDTPYPDHWAILDPPLDLAGVGRVKAVAVVQGSRGEEPTAFYLGDDFSVLKPLDIILFRRQRENTPEIPQFRRGDANSSGTVNVTDAISILLYQFEGGQLACPDAADFDDVGTLEVDDAILLLYYLFFDLDPPAAPGPLRCGEDVEKNDELPDCEGSACR